MSKQIQEQFARLGPCKHHYTYQIRSDTGKHTTWMNLSAAQVQDIQRIASGTPTPSSLWVIKGEEDPHGKRYDCRREDLTLGGLTDDELANGAFMNYDQPLDISRVLSDPNYYPPIAWMTAVKDRIRWLSRRLQEAEREKG